MQHVKQIEKDIFTDVIKKIQFLTTSQQKFLQGMLSHHKKVSTAASKKKLLKKSFGIWVGRKDINDSVEYVDKIRKGWKSRLEKV